MRPLSALAPILALVSCQPLPEARWRVLVDLASPPGTAALAPGASRLAPLSTRDPRLAAHADGQHSAVDPQRGWRWVPEPDSDTVWIEDPDSGAPLVAIDTATGPCCVAFAADGRLALVACRDAGRLQAFAPDTHALLGEADLLGDRTEHSPLPCCVAISPCGRRAFVACGRGEFLAAVDLQSFAVFDRIPAPGGPRALAVVPLRVQPDDEN